MVDLRDAPVGETIVLESLAFDPMHNEGAVDAPSTHDFEVLARERSPEMVRALAIDGRGRLPSDLGPRDTVLAWPGEMVRMAIRFAMPFAGPQLYMFHCHNLEHEDGGMMLGVNVA